MTMMFRKLYWVTESVDELGHSHVTGVFTSIPDLIEKGLTHEIGAQTLRLSLLKLDCENGCFGTWSSPTFAGIGEKLTDFVNTGEFTFDECRDLVDALRKFNLAAVS